MAVFILPQLAKFCGLFGITGLQAGGKIFVNPCVLFLQRNGQGQDFTFTQAVESSHRILVNVLILICREFELFPPALRAVTARRAVPTRPCYFRLKRTAANSKISRAAGILNVSAAVQ